VVGSLNMDIVTRVHRFPVPGETLHAIDTSFHAGGKGANQAVAAAKLGASVAMVGGVGSDAFGGELVNSLADCAVDTSSVQRLSQASTGIALITVDDAGRNSILISAGANVQFTFPAAHEDATFDRLWQDCHAVLLQHEIAPEVTEQAVHFAAARGIRVLYNPAPAAPIPSHLLAKIDVLVLNEHEASMMTGQPVVDFESAHVAAATLRLRGARAVVLTLGARGLVYQDREGVRLEHPAFPVITIDTTAAGDTFIGALAVALVENQEMPAALAFASAAAALSVTKIGAQSSVPNRHDVELFLQHNPVK